VIVALAAVSLPQFVVLFRPALLNLIFEVDAQCPRVAYVQEGAAYYYRCTNHELWTKGSVVIDAYSIHAGRAPLAMGLACCLLLAWLLALAIRPRIPAPVPAGSGK
jgi:hypothetical protein